MPEEDIAIEDAPVEAEPAPVETAPAQPQQRIVVDPTDGVTYTVSEDEYKSLADMGFTQMRRGQARQEPEPEPTYTVPDTSDDDDDEDDPVSKELLSMRKMVQEAHMTVSELKKAREEDQKAQSARQKQEDDRRFLERLAKENAVDSNNTELREMIEDRTMRAYHKALADRRPVTYEALYKESATFFDSLSRSGKREWIKGKVDAKEHAVEGPGGTATAMPETPALPKSKEEQRKLAREFDNGAITARAHERFNRLMNRS